jgi:hypothetical protein
MGEVLTDCVVFEEPVYLYKKDIVQLNAKTVWAEEPASSTSVMDAVKPVRIVHDCYSAYALSIYAFRNVHEATPFHACACTHSDGICF